MRWFYSTFTTSKTWNLALDLKILLRTIPAVVTARGAY